MENNLLDDIVKEEMNRPRKLIWLDYVGMAIAFPFAVVIYYLFCWPFDKDRQNIFKRHS